MAKNAKQVTLPAAAQNMAQQALDHLPADHFVFDAANASNPGGAHRQPIDHVPDQALPHVPAVIPPPVTLPDAAGHMSETATEHLPDHLMLNTALLGDPGAASQPVEHVPDRAQSQVPADVPPPVTLPDAAAHMSEHAIDHLPDHLVFNTAFVGEPSAGSQPLDHVPDQAGPHVPEVVPPDVTLPGAAADHMSDVAKTHLALHTDWFV